MARWQISSILLLLLATVPAEAAHNPAIDTAHKTTHEIELKPLVDEGSKCSATAIAPHALLTASHCERPVFVLELDGKTVQILGLIRDDYDHTIYLLPTTFTAIAEFAPAPAKVGDDIFLFGNPGTDFDIFHKGYIASVPRINVGDATLPPILYDFNGWMGDSGAAVFNEDGKIVGVVSIGHLQDPPPEVKFPWPSYKLMGGYPLDFRPDALKVALTWTPDTK